MSDVDEVYESEQDGGQFVTDLESAVMSLVIASRVKEVVLDMPLLPECECE